MLFPISIECRYETVQKFPNLLNNFGEFDICCKKNILKLPAAKPKRKLNSFDSGLSVFIRWEQERNSPLPVNFFFCKSQILKAMILKPFALLTNIQGMSPNFCFTIKRTS